jgi:putative transposase
LNFFETAGKKSSSNFRYKFWEHENHPVILDGAIVFNQKINYLHWNPVTAGFVTKPWYWKYSSAVDYMTKEKALLDLVMLA